MGEGVVDSVPDVHVSEAVGSGDADAGLLGLGQELFLHLGSLGAVLLESCGEDGHAFDSGGGTVLECLQHEGVLDCDDSELNGLLDFGDVGVGFEAHDLPALGVDGVELSFEACVEHILYEHSAEFGLIV